MDDYERIPIIGTHRGVGIHDHQTPERIELVKTAIDRAAAMSDILQLVDFAADRLQPPEARMFAARKVEVEYELAAERRENRPTVDLDKMRASVGALDSVNWRSPWRYTSILDYRHEDAVEREHPLPEDAKPARKARDALWR